MEPLMIRRTHITVILLSLLLLMAVQVPGRAQNFSTEQVGEFGVIDWLSQRVYAKGVGIFPDNKTNMVQARAMAHRAALVVAQRNLLGVIKGVHIDSTTVVENRIATDDAIVAKIEGIVQFCKVESTRMLNDRAIEVVVSMPISGKLGEILVNAIEGAPVRADGPPAQSLAQRLEDLEKRVRLLEGQMSFLKKASVQKEDLIDLFKQLSAVWQDCAAGNRFMASHAGYASDTEAAAIRDMLNDQEKRLASLSVLLNDLDDRLSALETQMGGKGYAEPSQPMKSSHPYTGLIVDARNTAFRPCLKPGLFINGEMLYPGDYLDLKRTVEEGYVRYYSDAGQAQQSERVGALPYMTTAAGTYGGNRGLAVSTDAYQVLEAVRQSANNFLAQARVVIVIGSSAD